MPLREVKSELHGRDGQKRTGVTKWQSRGRDRAALMAYGENHTLNRLNEKISGGGVLEEKKRVTF